MANSEETFNISTCQDLRAFTDYLKRLRKDDDAIRIKLNDTIKTSSFEKDPQHIVNSCINFNKQLQEAHAKRQRALETCLNYAEERVSTMKKAKEENESDPKVQKEYQGRERELKKLRKEAATEALISESSLKALHDACMRYVNL